MSHLFKTYKQKKSKKSCDGSDKTGTAANSYSTFANDASVSEESVVSFELVKKIPPPDKQTSNRQDVVKSATTSEGGGVPTKKQNNKIVKTTRRKVGKSAGIKRWCRKHCPCCCIKSDSTRLTQNDCGNLFGIFDCFKTKRSEDFTTNNKSTKNHRHNNDKEKKSSKSVPGCVRGGGEDNGDVKNTGGVRNVVDEEYYTYRSSFRMNSDYEEDCCTSSMVTLPLTPSRESTLRRVEECKWKDSSVSSASATPGGGPVRMTKANSFLSEILETKDRFLERLEYDRSIPRRKKNLFGLVKDDSGASAGASPLVRLRSGSSSAGGGAGHQHSHHHHQQQRSGGSSSSSSVTGGGGGEWTAAHSASSAGQDEDLDRLMRLQSNRSLSSLGLRSDSMASVYSGAGDGRYGAVAVKGEVEFGLQYNYKTSSLQILVRRARDLAQVDAKRSRSDPYVKVYLLPDKSKSGKRKTKVKKHTVNPVFDETLSFQLSLDELKTRTLWLTVWHSDMFGRNDFLGEVMMSLEDKLFDDPAPMWYPLQERTEPFEETYSHKGDIILALKFVPPSTYGSTDSAATGGVGGSGSFARKHKKSQRGGALHVLVKEAKNLVAVKANGTSDPFCKSYLLPDKGRSSKQKTPVLRRNLNPAWNYTFVYDDVTESELRDRALELTVWDHDRLGSNEFLGMVRLSLGTGRCADKTVDWMDASDKEVSLWSSMLDRPNFWVESCIALRANSFGNTKNTSSSSTSSTTASAMGYT